MWPRFYGEYMGEHDVRITFVHSFLPSAYVCLCYASYYSMYPLRYFRIVDFTRVPDNVNFTRCSTTNTHKWNWRKIYYFYTLPMYRDVVHYDILIHVVLFNVIETTNSTNRRFRIACFYFFVKSSFDNIDGYRDKLILRIRWPETIEFNNIPSKHDQ